MTLGPPLRAQARLLGVCFDVSNSVAYGRELLRFLFGDRDAEFLFEIHHELYSFERVSTEIVGEAGFFAHVGCVNAELLYDDSLYFFCKFQTLLLLF